MPRPHACHADYTLAPADSGSNQKPVLGWYVFHDFAVFRTQSFGCHTRGMIKHADEARALKREDPQFSEELLLANALMKSAGGELLGLSIAWHRLNDRLFLVG